MGNSTAKEAALLHQREHADHTGSKLSRVLHEIRELQAKRKNLLTVERTNILETSLAYFKAPGSEFSPLEVKITTDGITEQSSDLGGPTREFFTLFFKALLQKDIDMFEGQDQGRNLFPVNNDKAISNGWFVVLGKAIVLSLASGGPGFPYLAPCIVSYLRSREYDHELNIGLVYNVVLRQLIKRINNAGSAEELEAAMDSDSLGYIDNCGWPRCQMITMQNRLELTQSLLRWEMIGKRAAALDQLRKGLNTHSFLDRTADIPEADRHLLHTNTEEATAEYLKKCLKKELAKLKTRDDKEERAKGYTLSCIEMMTDTEATNLFHFITGMSSLPVEDIPVEVEFNRSHAEAELPEAITCIQKLRIPLGNDSQMAFYSSFHKALSVGKYGFGGKDL